MKYKLNSSIQSQTGAALLAFVLLMIVGTSFLLVSKLNAKVSDRENINQTIEALEKAKQALISYALLHPERSNAAPARTGPGRLPCPNITPAATGVAGGACSFAGGTNLGRLPWVTLDISESFDGTGERLWYVISDSHRTDSALVNSQTAGTLALDGINDIVAIVFAPGSALASQNRVTGVFDPTQYIDGTNIDGDLIFSSSTNNPLILNDKAIAITRQELMTVVEKRVLAEVDVALENYRTTYLGGSNAYPWLSPFANPEVPVNKFEGNVTTSEGHLPTHIVGQTYNNSNPFILDWSGLPVPLNPAGAGQPIDACFMEANCTNQYGFQRNTVLALSATTCIWQNRFSLNCTADDVITNAGAVPTSVIRTYTINFLDDGSGIATNYANDGTGVLTVTQPTVGSIRARNIVVNGVLTGTLSITISDNPGLSRTVIYPSGTPLTNLSVSGIDYHIDATGFDFNIVDGDVNDPLEQAELPDWFINDQWNHLIYVAYPNIEALPGSVPACTVAVDCITLTRNLINQSQNVRAIIQIAGAPISIAGVPQARPSPNEFDYFENENNDLDEDYDQPIISLINSNDQIRIVNP